MTLPGIKTSIPGPNSRRFLKELHKVECPHVTFGSTDFPIFIKKAKGTSVFDVDGNRLLDLTSFFGVSGLGHAAPAIAKTIRQMSRHGWHAMGDVHPHVLKLKAAQAITGLLPQKLSQVFFSSSGSEAVETALKTAFIKTGKSGVIAFEGSYHGLGYGAMQAAHHKYFREPFTRQTGSFVVFKKFIEENTLDAQQINSELKALRRWIRAKKTKKIGAILIEPIQGRAGIRVADSRFLKGLKKICQQEKILLIFDEIFSGFGRSGKWFAFEYSGVIPDILCLGKGLANGFPISACVSSPAVFGAWGPSPGEAKHTSTFLGNPLGCAMILAVIGEMKKGQYIRRVSSTGNMLRHQAVRLQREFPQWIQAVRGRGLMLGLVFNKKEIARRVVKESLKRGLVILASGQNSEVVTFVPPFIITKTEITHSLKVIRTILQNTR